MKSATLCLLSALLAMLSAEGALVEKSITYEKDGVTMEGFLVHDDDLTEKRPSVLVIHQWMGVTDYEKQRCRMLAEMGFNVLAADVYGKGVRLASPAEAGQLAGKFKADRKLYRTRLLAALDVLRGDERTEASKIAVIGYCFGGTGALELARAGADVKGVVSFHGGLASGEGFTAKPGEVKAKVLVLHGAADPHVPAAEVADFQQEMTSAKADWQMVSYGGAVHAFTQREAGDDPSKGVAYNAAADRRSWEAMKAFFKEIFAAD